jgi:uncharacterized protein YndB with AHSA1/START domain
MNIPDVPHRFELDIAVPGTPEQVWAAIASADGITAWMMPTDLEPREGGAVTFHMGPAPDEASHGRVTHFEPTRRIAYEEDWATLVGHAGADVTPLVTEFLVEAQSGGSCVVRVVTSAFGTGADWENEFFEEMATGWAPMLDNLRLYLTHFPGQRAASLWAGSSFTTSPEAAIDAARDALGVATVGDSVTGRDIDGRVERVLERHFLVRVDRPVEGWLSFYAFGADGASGIHLVGYLFSDGAAAYVEREQPSWQRWLDGIAADLDARSGSNA